MTPVISTQPQEEPTIAVEIQSRKYTFMVDTGATYSCIGSEGSSLPLSGQSIQTVGFSGTTQIIPLTRPVHMIVSGKSIMAYPTLFRKHPYQPIGTRHPVPTKGNYYLHPHRSQIGLKRQCFKHDDSPSAKGI